MIVTCERCETEFQLDDARVPQSGARVRCSRCKHAFFVIPPAASRAEVMIDHALRGALEDDPTPDVTEDLLEAPADPPADPVSARAQGDDSESDWEFNGDLPADAGDSSPNLRTVRAPAASAAQANRDPFGEEAGESLELASGPATPAVRAAETARRARAPEVAQDLGSPVDWDFLGQDEERAAPAAAPQRASAPARGFGAAREPEPSRDAPLVVRRVVDAVGWLAVAALCAIAISSGLSPQAPAATSWPDPAPGIALENVRGRWVDNAALGRLYVVSGRVHNRAPEAAALPRLALELRDASGQAVGSPIPLRGSGLPELLRGADAVASAGSDLPGGLAGGVSWDFEVAAWPLPAEAARFAIRAGS